jgi:hypothetical protein
VSAHVDETKNETEWWPFGRQSPVQLELKPCPEADDYNGSDASCSGAATRVQPCSRSDGGARTTCGSMTALGSEFPCQDWTNCWMVARTRLTSGLAYSRRIVPSSWETTKRSLSGPPVRRLAQRPGLGRLASSHGSARSSIQPGTQVGNNAACAFECGAGRSRLPRVVVAWCVGLRRRAIASSSVCVRCGLVCAHATLRRRRPHGRGVPRVRPE